MRLLFLLLLVLSLNINSQAQDDQNTIGVDILRPLISDSELSRWLVTYERTINDKFTALIGLEKGKYEYSSFLINNTPLIEYRVEGYAVLLEGRFYPFRKNKVAPRGFFVGAYFKTHFLQEKNTDETDTEMCFEQNQSIQAVGIDVGYKIFNSWFIVEPVLGFGTAWSSGLGEDSRISPIFPEPELRTYAIRLAINVGVCF